MKYILYCRKSTDTEDKQVLSLESQKHEMVQLVEREGLQVVDVLTESRSAKEPGRPVFNDMLRMITDGQADAILCWKIDRLTRNPVDGGQIQWMLQKGLIKEIRTFERTYQPSDNVLLMNIEQAMANQYIRDLSTNVKRGNRAKLERGGWPAPAPFGYVNDRLNKTILVDEARAPYIRRAYELYASGTCSLKQIADTLYAEGLRTRSGRKVHKNVAYYLLLNRFYTGLMEREGRVYAGNHVPIVSASLYEQVQAVMHGRAHPKPEKHFYAARGFLLCDACGCMLTADTKKGYQYYYCTNGKGNCEEHKSYLRSEYVDGLLANLFLNLHFDDEIVDISGEAYRQSRHIDTSYISHALQTLHTELQGLEEKESLLTDAYTAKTLHRELYEIKMQEASNRRIELNLQIRQADTTKPHATFEQVREVFLDGNRAADGFLDFSPEEKRKTLGKVLSNARLRNRNIAQYQFKKQFDVLARTPKNADFQTMCAQLDSNQRPFA